MALDKAGLISELTTIFGDVDPSSTPATKASAMADAIDEYVKTATVSIAIPSGQVSQGASPAVAPNAAPINLTDGTLS